VAPLPLPLPPLWLEPPLPSLALAPLGSLVTLDEVVGKGGGAPA